MNANGNGKRNRVERRLSKVLETHRERVDEQSEERHIVFDFTGLNRPDVTDLALILTARLQAPPHENVWVRALDPRTDFVLKVLGLDHLFRHYPGQGEMH